MSYLGADFVINILDAIKALWKIGEYEKATELLDGLKNRLTQYQEIKNEQCKSQPKSK